MKYKIYQVDAFTDKIFAGNPACVIPLKKWLADDILLKIAKENGVAETAYFINKGNYFHLRWFTPEIEMDLCGHATLATAHVIKSILNYSFDVIKFKTLSGSLTVLYKNELYNLNLPARMPVQSEIPQEIKLSLNIQPKRVFKSRDYLLVYENEEQVKNITINKFLFDQINLGSGGVIVTAQGNKFDFVSRFFTPQATILEDPVTGSAHCTLIPFWSSLLKKKNLIAAQLSQRSGILLCKNENNRVIISGKAITYSKGEFYLNEN